MEILLKTKTLEERVFYIHQAATLHWDKYTLFVTTSRLTCSTTSRRCQAILPRLYRQHVTL